MSLENQINLRERRFGFLCLSLTDKKSKDIKLATDDLISRVKRHFPHHGKISPAGNGAKTIITKPEHQEKNKQKSSKNDSLQRDCLDDVVDKRPATAVSAAKRNFKYDDERPNTECGHRLNMFSQHELITSKPNATLSKQSSGSKLIYKPHNQRKHVSYVSTKVPLSLPRSCFQ